MPSPGNHFHAQPPRDSSDVGADRAETQETHHLAAQLDHLHARPFARTNPAVQQGDLSDEGQQNCNRMLGHRQRIGARRIRDRNTELRRSLQIHIVGPRTPYGYQSEVRTGLQDRAGQMRVGPDIEDHATIPNPLDELLF